MTVRYRYLPVILLLSLVIVLAYTVNVASSATSSHSVELRVGDDVYVILFDIQDPVLVAAQNKVSMSIRAELVYATTDKPLFVAVTVNVEGINVSSAILGFISSNSTIRVARLEGMIPAVIVEKLAATTEPTLVTVYVKAYRGSTVVASKVYIPVTITKVIPALQVFAAFNDTGLPYSIAVIGKDAYKVLRVTAVNTGSAPVSNIFLTVRADNTTVLSRFVAENLSPASNITTTLRIPVPTRPGVYSVYARVEAVSGLEHVQEHATAVLVVLPRVVVSLSALNTTTILEGQQVCFRIQTYGTPSFVLPAIVVQVKEERERSWNTVAVYENSTEATYCWEAPIIGLSRPVRYIVRAILVLRIYGVEYSVTSNPASFQVLPIVSMIGVANLQLVAEKTSVYSRENIKLKVILSPSTPACIPARLEAWDKSVSAWQPITVIKVCNGEAVASVPASELGYGEHSIRATTRIGWYRVTSNVVVVRVGGEPSIEAWVSPKIVTPNTTVKLIVKIEPLIDTYTVIAKPSWVNTSITVSSSSPTTTLQLSAPSKPGTYHVSVVINIDGYKVARNLSVTVAKPEIEVSIKPDTIKAGETQNISLIVTITPPLDTAASYMLVKDKKTVASGTLPITGGRGETVVPAPMEPGNYTITVNVSELGLTAEKQVRVIKVIYDVTLSLNTTTTQPGKPVLAIVNVVPKPTGSVPVVLLARTRGGVWETMASSLVVDGRARIVFNAPTRPGVYEVQASLPSLQAKSSTVNLTVTEALAEEQQLRIYAVLAIAAIAALAWSIRWLRR